MAMRLSWDDLWMGTAKLVGQRSLCSRAQYGAVIVSEDNRILSVGYNGAPANEERTSMCENWCIRAMNAKEYGEDHVDPHYRDCHAIHAELNSIMRASNLWLEKDGATLYVNAVTCLRCALAISNSGIKRVVMLITPYEMKRDPLATEALFKQYNIGVTMVKES
jgi:dCMP deaminase